MGLETYCLPVLEDNYIWILRDPKTSLVGVVDPAEAPPVLHFLESRGWTLNCILNTHHHEDHVGGNRSLKDKYGCEVVGYANDRHRIPGISIELAPGTTYRLGEEPAQVLFLPGHTLGHIAFYFYESKKLFVGDTLFAMGCGRLFEGTPEQMLHSLEQISQLPESTQIFCGHEYTLKNLEFARNYLPPKSLGDREQKVKALRKRNQPTIPFELKEELETNPFLNTKSIYLRNQLDLSQASDLEVFTELRRRRNHF